MVLEQQLETVASVILGVLLVLEQVVLVVVDARVDVG